jgi:hypothetical protein
VPALAAASVLLQPFVMTKRHAGLQRFLELTIISTERVAFFAECTLADLPRIALTDYNPRKVAFFVHGSMIDVADMRLTPSSDRTYILADRI